MQDKTIKMERSLTSILRFATFSKLRPWKIKTSIAFADRERALAFGRHLKSSSGRAFARKRL
jgi:hypothetical protein